MHALALTLFISMNVIAGALVLSYFAAAINGGKLEYYLMTRKYERWCELRGMPKPMSGGMKPLKWNPFRGVSYLYEDSDENEEEITRYKKRIRSWLKRSLFLFIALCINVAILIALLFTLG